MAHSLTRIRIHTIWSTKDQVPLMKDNFRNLILKHIKGNFNDLASPVRIIGGLPEHLHVLFLLN